MSIFGDILKARPATGKEKAENEKTRGERQMEDQKQLLIEVKGALKDIRAWKYMLETKIERALEECRSVRANNESNTRKRDKDAKLNVFLSEYWYAQKLEDQMNGFLDRMETTMVTAEFVERVNYAMTLTDIASGKTDAMGKRAIKGVKRIHNVADKSTAMFERISEMLMEKSENEGGIGQYVPNEKLQSIIDGTREWGSLANEEELVVQPASQEAMQASNEAVEAAFENLNIPQEVAQINPQQMDMDLQAQMEAMKNRLSAEAVVEEQTNELE